ncbi:YifB family Mg chelatase-like AAA ATPase [Corynebacterium bovis]|uniref:YifB family Mg chelatase-like AAA ATPase n=2 Tax=Corynebacterium bovis TaxID=36808 RepID=UPI0021AB43C8|nr:YifB family Mg chelatase-like AAA ATPase [Corynebacterium bovis]
MSVGQALGVALDGIDGVLVTVECDIGRGLPGMSVVGLGDTAVVQARDRVRSATVNSGLEWPRSRVVMSLSPASVPKAGSGFDVAMVCSVIAAQVAHSAASTRASRALRAEAETVRRRLGETVLVGELGLDGQVRPVDGVLPMLLHAAERGVPRAVVPAGNAAEAAHADGVDVLVTRSLVEVVRWLRGVGDLEAVTTPVAGAGGAGARGGQTPDLADVIAQPEARRAVELAAAGGHHLMLTGPPGSGKSMLAERLPGILPPMDRRVQLEAAAVHSVAGASGDLDRLWAGVRPFIAPHHTVSPAALLGGGSGRARPGAVSLAHRGVLFLDEVAEASGRTLDCLRTPMERGVVDLVRSRRTVHFPARFQLIMAANRCPCGAESPADCTCTAVARRRYSTVVSGPLRDRVDIFVTTRGAAAATLTPAEADSGESTQVVSERVIEARARARHRWSAAGDWLDNASVPGAVLRRDFPADEAGMLVLRDMLHRGELSQRGVDRALRVAWTIADVDGEDRPDVGRVLDAVELFGDGEDGHDHGGR